MNVRAKFLCIAKEPEGPTAGPVDGYRLEFMAVTEGSEENDTFFKYTPFGQLAISTINVEAAEQFAPGKSYYLDFIPVE